jgi:Protein of unknown function (DUF3300)
MLALLILFVGSVALADDFKTIDGKEYKNVTVRRVEPDGIVLTSKSGISKVYFAELPKEVQERYHYDPEKAAAYSAAVNAAQEQARKQQEEAMRQKAEATQKNNEQLAEEAAPKIPNDQLDSLVAPIALYPDPLLAQILAASTYPLEVIQLEQWMAKNKYLKDQALAGAVAKQPWDPSVQAMAIYPDVVTRLSENVAWTSDLGNAFLAQQSDVMSAIQRMRGKAQSKGTLKTTEQQEVETEPVEGGTQIITIEPANPQYVYVPSYDPTVVYGPPIYPYPPYYYPGYAPGMGLAFGTGVVLGAAWANNWGNCNWHGGGDVTINNKNNFNRNNINNVNRGNAGGGKWQHNPSHRGGAPYGDRGTANKYSGRARQQPAGGAGNRMAGGPGAGTRPGGGAGVGGAGGRNQLGGAGSGARSGGGAGAGNIGGGNRPGAGGAGAAAGRASGGTSTMSANRGGGGNSIGNRSVSSGSGFSSSSNAFGGGGGGNYARSASSRGGASMGGGGFSRGGGGGGGRGGGGGGGGRRR